MQPDSDEEIENDYLEDSEDEESGMNEVEEVITSRSHRTEYPADVVYEQFINKVKSKDLPDASVGSLDTYDDEDDEDEYVPNQVDSDYDDSDYDEDDEMEDKLHKRELKALLQDCFLEIAGNKPELNFYDTFDQTFSTFPIDEPSQIFSMNSVLPSQSIPPLTEQQDPQASSKSEMPQTPTFGTVPPHSNSQVLNHVVNQLFAGVKIADLTMYSGNSSSQNNNIPVQMIRKIIARQLSMAMQLLIQILLQAETHSESFDGGYKSLLQLSNLRNQALKKATLLQMNIENMLAIRNSEEKQNSYGTTRYMRNNELQQLIQDVQQQQPQHPQHQQTHILTHQQQQQQQHLLPHLLPTYPTQGAPAMMPMSSTPFSPTISLPMPMTYPTSHTSYPPPSSHLIEPYPYASSSSSIPSSSSSSLSRPLTRSSLLQHHKSTYSILDIPLLARMTECIHTIDQTKQFIQHQIQNFQTEYHDSPSHHTTPMTGYGNHLYHHQHSMHQEWQKREYLFTVCSFGIKSITKQMHCHLWNCLIPTMNYPFPKRVLQSIMMDSTTSSSSSSSAASSIHGRLFITPAEEDLLLRGIIHTTSQLTLHTNKETNTSSSKAGSKMIDGIEVTTPRIGTNTSTATTTTTNPVIVMNWPEIQQGYLPSKDFPLLQYYYEQKVQLPSSLPSSSSNSIIPATVASISYQSNDFRRYQHILSSNKKLKMKVRDDRWLFEEDLFLVKGYQLFGDKYWFLIGYFFLPHRKPYELKHRWSIIQKVWHRAFPMNIDSTPNIPTSFANTSMLIPYYDVTLTPHIKAFLFDLNQARHLRAIIRVAEEGGDAMKALERVHAERQAGVTTSASVSGAGASSMIDGTTRTAGLFLSSKQQHQHPLNTHITALVTNWIQTDLARHTTPDTSSSCSSSHMSTNHIGGGSSQISTHTTGGGGGCYYVNNQSIEESIVYHADRITTDLNEEEIEENKLEDSDTEQPQPHQQQDHIHHPHSHIQHMQQMQQHQYYLPSQQQQQQQLSELVYRPPSTVYPYDPSTASVMTGGFLDITSTHTDPVLLLAHTATSQAYSSLTSTRQPSIPSQLLEQIPLERPGRGKKKRKPENMTLPSSSSSKSKKNKATVLLPNEDTHQVISSLIVLPQGRKKNHPMVHHEEEDNAYAAENNELLHSTESIDFSQFG